MLIVPYYMGGTSDCYIMATLEGSGVKGRASYQEDQVYRTKVGQLHSC